MTDSGAYQILVYGGVEVTQPEIIEYQKKIRSDIAVILDIPTGWDVPREKVEYTVDETLRRAEAAIPLIEDSDALWVGPVQGGKHLDLVAKSAKSIGEMPFQVHALGSPTEVMERYMFPVLVDMIVAAKRNLPPDRPLHLFGAGHPMMFSLAAALGCDLFDSASYALYAKDGRYLTPHGTLRLEDISYLPCTCPVCRKHTAEELKTAIKSGAGEAPRRAQPPRLHVRDRRGEAGHLRGEPLGPRREEGEGPPRHDLGTQEALGVPRRPREGEPRLQGPRRLLLRLPQPRTPRDHPVHPSPQPELPEDPRVPIHSSSSRPLPTSHSTAATSTDTSGNTSTTRLGEDVDRLHFCFYAAPYGPVPADLSETYPLSQFEIATPLDLETIRHTAGEVANYVACSGHKAVYLYRGKGDLDDEVEGALMDACEEARINLTTIWNNDPWNKDAFSALSNTLKTRK